MQKAYGLLLFVMMLSLPAYARMSLIEVTSPLQNPELLQMVQKSVADFLEFENDEIIGRQTGKITNVTVVTIAQSGTKTLALQVYSEAIFSAKTKDSGYEYSDQSTICHTLLIATQNDGYYADNTTCDFDPRREYETPSPQNYLNQYSEDYKNQPL